MNARAFDVRFQGINGLAMTAKTTPTSDRGCPSGWLRQRDETLGGFVEQFRFFQTKHVARLGKEGQAGRREMLLQKQARFDAGVERFGNVISGSRRM